MTQHQDDRDAPRRVQLLGIGVGPANLSLASLLHGCPQVSHLFLDRRWRFGWHEGQQLPGAQLQVSPLKDLVTLADPTNPYSFLAFLHEHGRLHHFINARFDAVPRREFGDYLAWAAARNENVLFGEEVLEVDFDGCFTVRTSRRTLRADNLSIGVGTCPALPPFARTGPQDGQFHISEFVERAADLAGKRVCVVGGGQSGAEAVLDLASREDARLPEQISWVSSRSNFLPIDDSPFTNDYFTPSYSDYFAKLDADRRAELNTRLVLASDGITEQTLREVYQRAYTLRFVHGDKDRLTFRPNREVVETTGSGRDGWRLRLRHQDAPQADEWLDADVIVWATGFRPAATDFLAPIEHRLEREGEEYRIDSDFAVVWDGPADRRLFVQNGARGQRGLADPNLSLIAWRSMRILNRLRGESGAEPEPSFIDWSPSAAVGAHWGAS
jgi:lysine N6-hydroxylase